MVGPGPSRPVRRRHPCCPIKISNNEDKTAETGKQQNKKRSLEGWPCRRSLKNGYSVWISPYECPILSMLRHVCKCMCGIEDSALFSRGTGRLFSTAKSLEKRVRRVSRLLFTQKSCCSSDLLPKVPDRKVIRFYCCTHNKLVEIGNPILCVYSSTSFLVS